jgi:hypothetical protein
MTRPDREDPAVYFVGFDGLVFRPLLSRSLILGGRGVLAQHALYGGCRDAMAFGDLAQALAMLAVSLDGGMVDLQRIAADGPAFKAGPPHAALDSFNDQIALQFSNSADDDHYGPAQWPGRVDVFPERDILDFQPAQFVQDIEEMLDRPGDPVRSSEEHDVEAAAAGVGHHLIQPWPARLRAADLVHILLHDFKAARFTCAALSASEMSTS